MSETRPFNEIKLQWLSLLTQDKNLSTTAIAIAVYIVTTHYNSERNCAWPSYQTIADATGRNEKTVQRAVRELEAYWFTVKRGNGLGHSTEFAPSHASIITATHKREKTDKIVPLHPPKGGQNCSKRVTKPSYKGGQNHKTHGVDLDQISRNFSRFNLENMHNIDVWENGSSDFRELEETLSSNAEKDYSQVIIDTALGNFQPLCTYLMEIDIQNLLVSRRHEVCFHSVLVGGTALMDTMKGLQNLHSHFPTIPLIIWQNPFFGKIQHDGKTIEQSKLFEKLSPQLYGIVSLPELVNTLFQSNLEPMLTKGQIFKQARNDCTFDIFARQRLVTLWRDIRQAISLAEL